MARTAVGRVVGTLASLRLTMLLLVGVIAASAAGSLLPEERARGTVFHAPWFTALLAALAVNIVACTLKGRPLARLRLGSTLVHVSILLILGGGVIGNVAGVHGWLQLPVGKAVAEIRTDNGAVPLPFALRLARFDVETDPVGRASLAVSVPGAAPATIELKAPIDACCTEPRTVGDRTVRVLRYLPDFVMGDGGPATRSAQPNNPALQVEVAGPAGAERRWVFARYPEFDHAQDGAAPAVGLRFAFEGGAVRQYRSTVEILDRGRVARTATVGVNEPLRLEGYTFFQSSYDSEGGAWSGLQATRDPGVPVVYLGFMLQIVGLAVAVLLNPRWREAARRIPAAAPAAAPAPRAAVATA